MEIKSIQQSGFTVRILVDQDPGSPTDWDNLGEIAYTGRYVLGTQHCSRDELDEIAEGIESGRLIGLPVYAYVHGQATIRTSPFSCPWDSGQSGFVYCRASDAEDQWPGDSHFRANALRVLAGEVKTFDQYLRGDVYGYVVTDPEGNEVDSCWGLYGIEDAEQEARSALDFAARAAA